MTASYTSVPKRNLCVAASIVCDMPWFMPEYIDWKDVGTEEGAQGVRLAQLETKGWFRNPISFSKNVTKHDTPDGDTYTSFNDLVARADST